MMDDLRERVARALCEQHIRFVRRHDTPPAEMEAMMSEAVDYSWTDFVDPADAALSATPIEALQQRVERLEVAGKSLVAAVDQMIEDTTPIFAEMELVRGRAPYSGKQVGDELDAFKAALGDDVG